MEANYFKKAVGNITFLCQEGKQIQETIEESILTGEPKTVSIKSTGENKNGEIIAEFLFTWSFKVKPV
jgi:hypothetical protein